MDMKTYLQTLANIGNELEKRLSLIGFLTKNLQAQNLPPPVIVGGCAVEIYTFGKYMTQDIDILGAKEALFPLLHNLEFQQENGIFWNDSIGIVIDWQGNGSQEPVLNLKDSKGQICASLLNINDLIIDRLCAKKFWKDTDSFMWAEILYNLAKEKELGLDQQYLQNRAVEEDVAELVAQLDNEGPKP